VLVAGSVAAFGADGWLSFFSTLMNRDANLSPNPPIHILLASIYGILFSAGIGAPVALAAHGAVMLILAAAVWITWRSPIPYPLRAALLCVASLLATPYALFYDFCLLAIAFGFLIRDGLARGFLPGERSTVLFCWLILDLGGVQIGPVTVCMLLLLLLYRRIAVLGQQQQPVPVAS
jgi:hypothetical protein